MAKLNSFAANKLSRHNLKVAGLSLLVSSVLFLLFLNIAQFFYPNYNPLSDPTSSLSAYCANGVCHIYNELSPVFFDLALVSIAVGLLLFGCYAYKESRRKLFLVFSVIPALGALGAVVFSQVVSGLHLAFSLLFLIVTPLLIIRSSTLSTGTVKNMGRLTAYSIFTALAVIFLIVVYASNFNSTNAGLAERLVIFPLLVWGIVFGSALTRATKGWSTWLLLLLVSIVLILVTGFGY